MQFQSSPSIGPRHRLLTWGICLLLLTLTGCREKAPVISKRFTAFGSAVDISLVEVPSGQANRAAGLIAADFAQLESEWRAGHDGPLIRVNRLLKTGDRFIAPPSLIPLIEQARTFESQSDGLFNPAIGGLMALWGFDETTPPSRPPPANAEIARLVAARPSMTQIDIAGLELRGRNPALELNLLAIARSRAVDIAIEHLRDLGIHNALIQAGGDLRAIGDRSGQPWRITIRRANGSGVFAILPLHGDESVATVADYDRNFIFANTLYHAILDPRTGRPAEGFRAVTVVHRTAATAAAAAAALFVAGPADWERIGRRMDVDSALLMERSGKVRMTPAMARRVDPIGDGDSGAPAKPAGD